MLKSGNFAGFSIGLMGAISTGLLGVVGAVIGELAKLLLDGMGVAIKSVTWLFTEMFISVLSILRGALSLLPDIPGLKEVKDGMITAVDGAISGLGGVRESINELVDNAITGAKATIDGVVAGFVETILPKYQTAADAMNKASNSMTDTNVANTKKITDLLGQAESAVAAIKSSASMTVNGKFIGATTGSPSGLGSAISGALGTTGEVFGPPSPYEAHPLPGVPGAWTTPLIRPVNDFIMTPSGQLIQPASDDFIMGAKNPGGMGGGVNITINVEGNLDDRTARYITDAIQRELATQWRSVSR